MLILQNVLTGVLTMVVGAALGAGYRWIISINARLARIERKLGIRESREQAL